MMFRIVFLLSLCGWLGCRGVPILEDDIAQSDSVLQSRPMVYHQRNSSKPNLGRSSRRGYTCVPNEYDGDQWCLCKPGEKVSTISSVHSNWYEDRVWTLGCSTIVPEFKVPNKNVWYGATAENEYDGPISWNGQKDDMFLVGMTSKHKNWYEDRKFSFFTVGNDNWYLTDCVFHKDINNWDGKLEYTLGDDEVFAGLTSYHGNRQEDRRWSLKVCKLRQKCTEIYKIEYDTLKANVTSQTVDAGIGHFDNRNSKSSNSFTAKISSSGTETLTESYEFSQTSGHSHEVSMSIAAETKFKVPKINEVTLQVTVGTSSTWNFEKTWTRGNSKAYSKANGRDMSFTHNCKAGCFCTLKVVAKKATGVIPYTMWSESVDKKHKCVEHGELTVDYSFNANGEATDVC